MLSEESVFTEWSYNNVLIINKEIAMYVTN